jgi:hypothetical protein
MTLSGATKDRIRDKVVRIRARAKPMALAMGERSELGPEGCPKIPGFSRWLFLFSRLDG